MSCPDHETLSAFADSELDASERANIERHLTSCASCREFVEEMSRLDASGRVALRSISVTERRRSVVILETAKRSRWLALAAAAVIVATVPLSIWFFSSKPKPAVEPPRTVESFQGSTDEAFERWAEPYRRLRIPLVPLEELASDKRPEVVPITRDAL
jgi:anti-sigma factor ChrR (cupin superfamily)